MAVLCMVIVCITGCGGQLQSGTSTALAPTRQSTVTLGVSATPAATDTLDTLGDQLTVAREIDENQVLTWFDSVDKTSEEFRVILQHANLQEGGSGSLSYEQKLLIYQEFKKLNAITLVKDGDVYTFRLRVSQRAAG